MSQREGQPHARIWWRDALVCASVGAFAGVVACFSFGVATPWLVIAYVLAGALGGALFGERFVRLLG